MTTYIVTAFTDDPDNGVTTAIDGDQLDTVLAEFRVSPRVPDGSGLLIRKADYAAPFTDPSYRVNGAADRDERRARTAEVFAAVYGVHAGRASLLTRSGDTVKGRVVAQRPKLHIVRNSSGD